MSDKFEEPRETLADWIVMAQPTKFDTPAAPLENLTFGAFDYNPVPITFEMQDLSDVIAIPINPNATKFGD